jgi:ABC-type spermidine/putrescine transport system permease subunit II
LVVLKYPNTITLTIGGGLTSSTVTSGDFKITTFTAGTDTVTVP